MKEETKITIRKPSNFLSFYIFVQLSNAGGFFFNVLNMMFAFPLCICDWHRSKIFAAFDKNEMVALVVASKKHRRIEWLFVRKEYRKQGIAKKLVDKTNCRVAIVSKKAIPFWQSIGFKDHGGICVKWN